MGSIDGVNGNGPYRLQLVGLFGKDWRRGLVEEGMSMGVGFEV